MATRQPAPPPPPVAKVDLYSRRFSADCMRAKSIFDRKGAVYSEYIIDTDEENERVMLYRSGGESSVPQIFINGKAIGGLSALEKLDAVGELDQILGQPPRDIIAEEAKAADRSGGGTLRNLLGRFGRR